MASASIINDETSINRADSPASDKSQKNAKGKRKASSLPADTVEYLKNWMMSPEHIAHPYPTEQEKADIMAETGIELKQLTNWFVNNRKRFWKPRVEARLHHQATAAAAAAQAHAAAVVAAAAAHTASPVTPDAGFKPSVSYPGPPQGIQLNVVTPHGVADDAMAGVLASRLLGSAYDPQTSQTRSFRTVSETSSSASVSASEYSSEDETVQQDSPSDDEIITSVQATREASNQTPSRSDGATVVPASPDSKRTGVMAYGNGDKAPPRKKFRRVSLDVWRDSCQKAAHANCESLPSLEEAARLFGYAA